MSPERIGKVFMNYFSSTKRETNEQIGGFGLGSKSPLAYVNYYYIITVYDKIKYTYLFSKGADAPTLDLLDEIPTEERNGTEIRFTIKNSEDESRFRTELKEQLCYFDNVYFHNWSIDNNYRIYEGNYFKYRNQDHYSDSMHIVLGKVCYPINWDKIGMEPIRIPVGVKFEIGELQVTPPREALIYNEQTTELVKSRIRAAYNECLDLYKSQNEPKHNYFEWYKIRKSKPYISFSYTETNADGTTEEDFDKLYLPGVGDVMKRHELSVAQDISFFKNDTLLGTLYERVAVFDQGQILDYKSKRRKDRRGYYPSLYEKPEKLSPELFEQNIDRIYLTKGNTCTEAFAYTMYKGYVFKEVPLLRRESNKRLWYSAIKAYSTNKNFVKISHERIGVKPKAGDYDLHKIHLSDADRGISRFGNMYTYFDLGIGKKFYEALKIIRGQIRERFAEYRELTPEEQKLYRKWKEETDATLRRKKEGKVLCKDMSVFHNRTYEWKSISTKKSDMPKSIPGAKRLRRLYKGRKWKLDETGIEDYKGIVIYGFRDDTKKLKRAVAFMAQFPHFLEKEGRYLNWSAVRIIQISQQSERFFAGKENMTHVDNLYSDNNLFRKLASSLMIEDYLSSTVRNMDYSINRYIEELGKICPAVADHFQFLYRYWQECHNADVSGTDIDRADLKHEILQIAKQHNLFDPIVDTTLKQIEAWFKGVEVLKFVEINEQSLPYILLTLREHKKKLNLELYQKVVTEDKLTIKGVDKRQLSLELVIEKESEKPKFQILTAKAA